MSHGNVLRKPDGDIETLDSKLKLATFQGPHIRSSCAPDGTWQPYPTCEVKQ